MEFVILARSQNCGTRQDCYNSGMRTQLTEQQRQAVDEHHGFLKVEAGGSTYVVLSRQVFREMMGVGSDADYRASLQAIADGLADVEAGRTRPVADFFREFDARHGIPG